MSKTIADTKVVAVVDGKINVTENALIVAVSISQWVARKQDKIATKAVEKKFDTSGNAGAFQKALVDSELLKEIQQIASELRTYHNTNTLPWGDNGDRFLPMTNYHEYMGVISQLKAKFEDKVKEFEKEYPALKADARMRLNGLFSEDDYPNDISSKFGIRIRPMPVPATEHMNVNLPEEELKRLKEEMGIEVENRLQTAINDIFKRLEKTVYNMVERLKDVDNKFKDSLVDNVKDIIKLAPKLNVYNDPKITELCKDMKKLVVNPNLLRADVITRKETCKKAEDILKKMKSFVA